MSKNSKAEFKNLAIDLLTKGRYQPRRVFDTEALQELADSIKANGIIQPIVVRPLSNHHYEIIAGERRWRAAQLAGLDTVPCLVNQYTDEQAAAVTTIENINRKDLNPIEEAQAYLRLIEEFGYTHEEVAAIVGRCRTKITNCLRLLQLADSVQQNLIDGKLSEGHGKILAGLPKKQQLELANSCIKQSWSVRKLEQAARKLMQPTSKEESNADLLLFERIISEQVGAEVKLDNDPIKNSGWLSIRYYDLKTLQGLLDKMGIKYEDHG